MNTHLAYFLTILFESIVLYIVLYYFKQSSHNINTYDIIVILTTNLVSVYSGFYLLPWLSNI